MGVILIVMVFDNFVVIEIDRNQHVSYLESFCRIIDSSEILQSLVLIVAGNLTSFERLQIALKSVKFCKFLNTLSSR